MIDPVSLRERLAYLRQLAFQKPKEAYELFGAGRHRFRLYKPLGMKAVEQFERRHQIRLPNDYKMFITEIGNGGAGPNYGLLRLQDWNQQLKNSLPDFLATPFRYEKPWNNGAANFAPGTYVLENLAKDYWTDEHITGSMRISAMGCGAYSILIVSGKQNGKVWLDERASTGGLFPAYGSPKNKTKPAGKASVCFYWAAALEPSGRPLSFIAWYTNWLESLIAFIETKL